MTAKPVTKSAERRHELLAEMTEGAVVHLKKKFGMSDEEAIDIGNWLADFLAEHFRGQSVYFPSDYKFANSRRDEEICARMERGNAHELAREYGLSFVRIYAIYRRHLAAQEAKLLQTQPGAKNDGLASKAIVKRPKDQGLQAHNIFANGGNF